MFYYYFLKKDLLTFLLIVVSIGGLTYAYQQGPGRS